MPACFEKRGGVKCYEVARLTSEATFVGGVDHDSIHDS